MMSRAQTTPDYIDQQLFIVNEVIFVKYER